MNKRPLQVVTLSLLMLYFMLGLSIPARYQTMTLWYKTGMDKLFLLAGQYIGMMALMLIFLQVILATRGARLTQLFGAANLIVWHRRNGLVLLALVSTHTLCILLPEGLANLPVGLKFWPEMIGALTLLVVVAVVFTSYFQRKLKLDYRVWKKLHKPCGYLVAFFAPLHVLFVSDSFTHAFPRLFIAGSLIVLAFHVVLIHLQKRKNTTAS